MILFQNTITLYDMKVIITRMFSHEGSRRGKMFALSWFTPSCTE